ncbi:MAG TPA: GAF domain-containing protein [Anaerolinea sp.]|nr:GAF domain-containing protein [Anaerolinea sp.]
MDRSVTVNSLVGRRSRPVRAWLPQTGLLVYLGLVLLAFVALPVLAFNWLSLPFPGFIAGPALTVYDVYPDTPAYQQGLRPGDHLVEVNGVQVNSGADLTAVLRGLHRGDEVALKAAQPTGQTVEFQVPVSSLTPTRHFSFIYAPMLVSLIYLAAAVWTFTVLRARRFGQVLTLFLASFAVVLAGLPDLFTTQALAGFWTLALGLAGGAMLNLAFLFPREDPLIRRRSVWLWLAFAPGVLLAVLSWFSMAGQLPQIDLSALWKIQVGLACAAAIFTLSWITLRRLPSAISTEREQLRFAMFSGIASFAPIILWMAYHLAVARPAVTPITVILPAAIFPVVIGYIVQRFRLQKADFILSRVALYGFLAVLVAVGYGLLVAGLSLIAGQVLPARDPIIVGLAVFILALVVQPLRARLQRTIDAIFFRGDAAYQQRLNTFSGELTRMVDLNGILTLLRQYILDALMPSRLHIFILDPLSETYAAVKGRSDASTSDVRFNAASPLVQALTRQDGPLVLADPDALPPALQAEHARLTLLGASTFAPLPGRERLSGWLAVGERISGELYSARDLNFLNALCDQAALAIERAQVMADMENRVRQMNVLARVAQGVNITLSIDDLLELIYAQTVQILPADELHIMLHDPVQDVYQYAFCLENDERLSHQENHPIPPGEALETEVIRQGLPIRSTDYNRECQRRGVAAPRPNLYGWMAVPLNTGTETIGALSLGMHDPYVGYTPDQQTVVQSIADQVAGAIVKARLLQETERRALQLTTLNEMTRQLTSTLDLEPLLHNILQSAVDILVCEAGSLLLVDETTEEMVFRVVVGPVAGDLVNRRMAPGSGVVGKSVTTREPIIVNDVTRYPQWFSSTDKQTGFITRALLVIPLQVKDKVIGVIEVINKRDGSPFSQDDQDLLSAFAAQAAVAIENARLYTMTDQALAARVEELSVMQRIDRELNTSLDTTRAMRITLEWAMRQSGAQAGLVGILQENGLRLMASQGYDTELAAYQEAPLAVDAFGLADILREAVPIHRRLTSAQQNWRLLKTAVSQVIVPIRREGSAIGILLLETNTPEPPKEEQLNFLARLSDHASVAIFNAQLYAAVQSANLAKSEFVSFVAHELKNPMTSVKGYTELLAAGAVGSVTETQTNFLNTIRSNIERMNTLVSDLNDLSKIEVGRLRLDYKAIQVAEVIESAVRSTSRQIDEKKQALECSLPADLPPAWADRTRLEQVLVNLVSNAHKYTPAEGKILVAAERCPNQWDPDGAPEVIHVWVSDTGIGISEEDQKKIFQKFFRSEDPKTREAPGTGLGLNITRSLVEMQGGTIWFESVYRQGTTFHFTVPVSAQ